MQLWYLVQPNNIMYNKLYDESSRVLQLCRNTAAVDNANVSTLKC